MKIQVDCICGNNLRLCKSFSKNFYAFKCLKCSSTTFKGKKESKLSFNYEESAKYNDENSLNNSTLRWTHFELKEILSKMNKSILEIGCFNGSFVKFLLDKKIDIYGIDINKNAINFGKRKFSLGDRLFNTEETFNKKINSLMMIDLLEHIESPNSYIKDLKKKHNNPEYIIIAGPISSRVFHDKSDFPPHHLWWFSEKGLRKMMENNNYLLTYKKYEKSPFLLIRNIIGRLKYGFNIREYAKSDKPFSGKSSLFKILDRLSTLQVNIPLIPKYNAAILIFKKLNN